MLEKEGPETPPDGSLLDLSDAAVKKLIRSAKKRGYVTHDQINALLCANASARSRLRRCASSSIRAGLKSSEAFSIIDGRGAGPRVVYSQTLIRSRNLAGL